MSATNIRRHGWTWVQNNWPVLAVFVVVAGSWEAVVRLREIPEIVLPAPSRIAEELYYGITEGLFLQNLWYTMVETVGGFAIAAALGVGLGAVIAEVPWTRRAIYPYVIGFQTVPKVALAPLLVIWFGFGLTSKVVVAATVAFFPIIVNTIEGLGNTDPARVDMIRAMGGGRLEAFRRVKVPSALPFVFAGLDAGIVLALLGAVVGEFIGSKVGLGNQMLVLNSTLDIPASFAVLILLSIVGYALHLVLVAVQRRVVFWTGPSVTLKQSA